MGIKSHIKINLIDDSVLDYLLDCIFINNKKFDKMAEECMEIIVENVKKIIANCYGRVCCFSFSFMW